MLPILAFILCLTLPTSLRASASNSVSATYKAEIISDEYNIKNNSLKIKFCLLDLKIVQFNLTHLNKLQSKNNHEFGRNCISADTQISYSGVQTSSLKFEQGLLDAFKLETNFKKYTLATSNAENERSIVEFISHRKFAEQSVVGVLCRKIGDKDFLENDFTELVLNSLQENNARSGNAKLISEKKLISDIKKMSKACVRAVNNFLFISSITKIKKSNGDLTYVEACNLSLESVKIVQIRLKELDLYPFAIDGIAGKGTLSAINKAKSKIGSKASVGECVTEQDIAEFQKLARRLDLAEKSSVKANGCTIYKLQNCTNEQICGYATFNENGSVSWHANSFWTKRAKEMRLDCGVVSKPVVIAKVPTCDDDPALCSVVQLCQKATLNQDGEKVWSGDSKKISYVEFAKSTGVTCGVKPKPVVVAKVPTCDDDPALCSVVQLCQKATLNKDGARVWSGDAKTTSYVDLAKSTGVTCGVKPKPVVVAKVPTCDDDPALCSVVQLCQKATLSKDGEKIWSGDAKSTSYVELAKSTGGTCGVI